jgi:hypothetical protein
MTLFFFSGQTGPAVPGKNSTEFSKDPDPGFLKI